jgi:hypothetical protein
MGCSSITLMLIYEPATSQQGPVPLARVDDQNLAVMVARSAIAAAEARAQTLSNADAYLGEVELAEVRRLREVLALLIPGLRSAEKQHYTPIRTQ